MTQRTQNFLELYFDAIDENIETVIGELNDAGIDPDQSQNRIMQMIKQKKADIKIESGKILRERVQEFIKKKFDSLHTADMDETLAVAYRKLEGLDNDDALMIKKDAALLNEIDKLITEAKDEA